MAARAEGRAESKKKAAIEMLAWFSLDAAKRLFQTFQRLPEEEAALNEEDKSDMTLGQNESPCLRFTKEGVLHRRAYNNAMLRMSGG